MMRTARNSDLCAPHQTPLLPVQFGAPLGFRLAAISVIGQFIPRDRIQLMIAQIVVRFVDEAQF